MSIVYYEIIGKRYARMLTSSLEQLKELNKNKDECKKCTKSYIIINPVIPIKSGNDITKKVKSIYNNFCCKLN